LPLESQIWPATSSF